MPPNGLEAVSLQVWHLLRLSPVSRPESLTRIVKGSLPPSDPCATVVRTSQ